MQMPNKKMKHPVLGLDGGWRMKPLQQNPRYTVGNNMRSDCGARRFPTGYAIAPLNDGRIQIHVFTSIGHSVVNYEFASDGPRWIEGV